MLKIKKIERFVFQFLSLVVSVEMSMEEERVVEEAEVMEAPKTEVMEAEAAASEWECLYLLCCY